MPDLFAVKDHLRIESSDEDTLLQSYLDAATASVADYLGQPLPDPVPAPVEAAILLRVGDLYENREGQTDRPLHGNKTFERLLQHYRVMSL
ncbi:MAG: head-tail connector protein [Brachymonas denitrificans]